MRRRISPRRPRWTASGLSRTSVRCAVIAPGYPRIRGAPAPRGGTRCGAAALAPAPAGAGCAAGRSGRGLLRAARAEHLGVHRILLPVQLVALEHAVGVEDA